VVLTDSGSRTYDISNDALKSAILKISNDDISGTDRPIKFLFDSMVGFIVIKSIYLFVGLPTCKITL